MGDKQGMGTQRAQPDWKERAEAAEERLKGVVADWNEFALTGELTLSAWSVGIRLRKRIEAAAKYLEENKI